MPLSFRVVLLLLLPLAACKQPQMVTTDAFPSSQWTWAWAPVDDQASYGTAVAADAGGVFATGFYGIGLYSNHTAARFGDHDLLVRGEMNTFLVRLDTLGRVVWARSYGDAGRLAASGLASGPEGTLYMVGSLAPGVMNEQEGRWVLEPRPLVSTEYRAFVARIDTTGLVQWGRLIDGIVTTRSVAVDPEGNVYVGGSAGMHPGNGVPGDAVLASFTADGEFRWSHTVAEGESATVQGIATASYGVCAAGHATEEQDSSSSGFVVGYGPDGEMLWERELSASPSSRGVSGNVLLYGTATSPDDACYISGGFSGTIEFAGSGFTAQDEPERINDPSRAHTDAVVFKYDRRGEPVWATQLVGGVASDFAHSITVGPDGRAVTAGTFMDTTRWGRDTLSVPYTVGQRSPRAVFAGILASDGTPLGAVQSMSNAIMSTSSVAEADEAYYVTGRMGSRVYVARLE